MAKEEKDAGVKNVVKIADSGPCKKKVSITVPEEKIKDALNEQYQELRRDAVVPGFRKGRAPLRLLEKRFGSDVGEQVKLKLLADASDTALKDNELDKLGDPDIDYDNIELPESGPMEFDFEVEVRPEFELPELEGIKIEKPKIEFDDKQIDQEVLAMRKRVGIWTPKDGPVETDDQVVADAVLNVEGDAEDQKHDNIEIFARKNGFVGAIPVENLDELLAGAKHGDVKTTSVDIPKTFFNEDYRGKKVDVKITVKDVKKLEPAELNKDFFARYGVDDIDELKEAIADSRKQQIENDSRRAMGEQVYKYLLDKTKFDLPADLVAEQSKQILQRNYTNMLMQGLTRELIDEQMEGLRGSSEASAKEQMKVFFIMDKIAEKFDITVSEEEINGHIAQVAASRGRRPEKMREVLAKDGSLAQFSLQIREQKCIEKLLESAAIKGAKTDKNSQKETNSQTKKAIKKTTKKAAAAPKKSRSNAVTKKTAKKKVSKTKKKTSKAKKTVKKATKKASKKTAKKGK